MFFFIQLGGVQKTIHIADVLTMPEGASIAFALVMDDLGKALELTEKRMLLKSRKPDDQLVVAS